MTDNKPLFNKDDYFKLLEAKLTPPVSAPNAVMARLSELKANSPSKN